MAHNGIRAVIFDLGNVLIDFDHTIAAKKIAGLTGKGIPQIYSLFFDSDLTARFEAGKVSPDDFFATVKKMLGLEIGYEEFLPIWNQIFFLSEKNRQVYVLAKSLKARYRTALLSNVNRLHYEYIRNTFPVFDAFHAIVTSFEAGCTKPERKIYEKTLRALGVSPESAVYTDDRQELVESALRLGIPSFTFRSVEQLKSDFASVGVRLP